MALAQQSSPHARNARSTSQLMLWVILAALPGLLTDAACSEGCDHALDHAIMTAPDMRDPAMVYRMKTIAGRVL